jgi:hypothetical protein
MGALKTTVVMFLLLMAGATTFLSVNADRMAGEPFQMVKVNPGDFEKQIAAAVAAEKQLMQQRAMDEQKAKDQEMLLMQQKEQGQAPASALQMTSQAAPLDMPVTGQRPPALKIDPNGGITATDMMP